jgi:hypothetical protein
VLRSNIHPARLEHAICSSEVRRVTNYAKDALYLMNESDYELELESVLIKCFFYSKFNAIRDLHDIALIQRLAFAQQNTAKISSYVHSMI